MTRANRISVQIPLSPMTHVRASVLILLAGCAADTPDVLQASDLCALADGTPSEVLRVELTLSELSMGLTGHGAVECDTGDCCNPALYMHSVPCSETARVAIVPTPTYEAAVMGTSGPSLECQGTLTDAPLATDPSRLGSPPPAECPAPTCDGPTSSIILIGQLDETGTFLASDWAPP